MKKFLAFALSFFPCFTYAQQAENFSFLTGSCAYVGSADGDTSLYVYRGEPNIFYAMSQKDADFMLWLGDNWYLDRGDWETPEGLWRKARYARTVTTTQPLIKKGLPEYATWDDHDFGPNQSQQDYPLKHISREIFIDTWKDNPSFGEDGEGIYTSFRKHDVRFILLDDRWWRDFDRLWDYKFFKPNPNKRMFGKKQMEWLKRQLLEDATATFKIIVNGSEVLNPWAKGDGLVHFPIEYNELLDFLKEHRINGVLFLTGDVHYSEIIKLDREDGLYPLYDVTVSPLTSTVSHPKGYERRNKYRLPGTLIETHNFARFSFSGDGPNRKLLVEFFDKTGKLLLTWSVTHQELTVKD